MPFPPLSLDLQLVRKQCLYNQDRDLAQGVQAFLTSRLAYNSILHSHQTQNSNILLGSRQRSKYSTILTPVLFATKICFGY